LKFQWQGQGNGFWKINLNFSRFEEEDEESWSSSRLWVSVGKNLMLNVYDKTMFSI